MGRMFDVALLILQTLDLKKETIRAASLPSWGPCAYQRIFLKAQSGIKRLNDHRDPLTGEKKRIWGKEAKNTTSTSYVTSKSLPNEPIVHQIDSPNWLVGEVHPVKGFQGVIGKIATRTAPICWTRAAFRKQNAVKYAPQHWLLMARGNIPTTCNFVPTGAIAKACESF